MKTRQLVWRDGGWTAPDGDLISPSLLFVFGHRQVLTEGSALTALAELYPDVPRIGCSTAGEIRDVEVLDDSAVATAVELERTQVVRRNVRLEDAAESRAAGLRLAQSFDADGLVHVFVLSDGLEVNGTELVKGLTEGFPDRVTVTGGLAGDGADFQQTAVLDDNGSTQGLISAVGFYGEHLRVGFASLGGWDAFGPTRTVTRATGNVLYELDGRSALELYKSYLGEHADELPAAGLLFPLALQNEPDATPVVRTILSVDEDAQSMTFAGDMPVGSTVQLMKANFDRLVEGAADAARTSVSSFEHPAELALLISCVGRKMVLRQRVEDEVEAVREVVGAQAAMTGFYSYGEISPFHAASRCELHNQTMTITTLTEV